VRALLQLFSQKKVSGVVLDLRGNGGGLLNHANDITGLFVDKGPVVAAKDAEGKLQVMGDTDAGEAFAGDLVVLVDRFSASAAEILAGALQDYERAVVVGTETHGKGTVQAMVDLDRVEGFRLRMKQAEPLGVVKLTIQQFFLVDGESTQWQGVKPDVALPDQASYVDSGERFLENAIPWGHIDPLPATHWAHPKWNLAALREKSAARQTQEPTFAKVTARGDYLRARREDTVVPLQREAWQQKRTKERNELDQLDPKVDEGPERFQVAMLEYRPAEPSPETTKRAGGATHVDRWKQTLAHDPWVAESLQVLADMNVRNAPTNTSK
jgi:carboxyl-terminal processing protease